MPIGTEGYTSAGSTALLRGAVLHPDRLDQGRRQVRRLRARAGQADRRQAEARSRPQGGHRAGEGRPSHARGAVRPAAAEPGRSSPKYVAQDVFGYSFLSDVFMADYKDGDVTWQGFLRPYPTPRRPRRSSRSTCDGAKQDGAEIRTVEAEGADRMVVQLEHRPGRRRSSSRATWSAAPTARPTAQAGRGVRPEPSSRPCPPTVPAIEAEEEARGLEPTPRRAGLSQLIRSSLDRALDLQLATPAPLFPPRSRDERETDQDPAEEPGAARGRQPGRRVVLAAAVRHPGRRHAAVVGGARRRPGSWSATAGAWKASSRRPRSGSRTTRSRCRPSRPNMVVVRSTPPTAEDFASAEEELQAREDQALKMVKAALEEMGGDRASAVHHQGRRRGHQAERRVRQEPRPRRDHSARHRLGRRQALPRRRRPQGDRRRQPDQQPRELLLQDQGRRRRAPRRAPS